MKVFVLNSEWKIDGEMGFENFVYDSEEKAQQAFKKYVQDEKDNPESWVRLTLNKMEINDYFIIHFEDETSFGLSDENSFIQIWYSEKEVM